MLGIERQYHREMQIAGPALIDGMRALPVDEIHAVGVRLGNDGQLLNLLASIRRIFNTGKVRSGAVDGLRKRRERTRLDARTREPHDDLHHGRWSLALRFSAEDQARAA